jgi:hypothetical protein
MRSKAQSQRGNQSCPRHLVPKRAIGLNLQGTRFGSCVLPHLNRRIDACTSHGIQYCNARLCQGEVHALLGCTTSLVDGLPKQLESNWCLPGFMVSAVFTTLPAIWHSRVPSP